MRTDSGAGAGARVTVDDADVDDLVDEGSAESLGDGRSLTVAVLVAPTGPAPPDGGGADVDRNATVTSTMSSTANAMRAGVARRLEILTASTVPDERPHHRGKGLVDLLRHRGHHLVRSADGVDDIGLSPAERWLHPALGGGGLGDQLEPVTDVRRRAAGIPARA